MSPKEALEILIEGNNRFTKSISTNRDLLSIVNIIQNQSNPFAAILGCSDSRTSTELIFDQGLGDIFSVRLTGNIATKYAIGSLEYACKYSGVKLIVVLGHTGCGIIKAACDNHLEGNIAEIVKMIEPAVHLEEITMHSRDSTNPDFVNNVCRHNVNHQIQNILDNSKIIRDLLAQKRIGIAAAIYEISTGKVTFDLEKSIL
jgi:carbonic anhydrase